MIEMTPEVYEKVKNLPSYILNATRRVKVDNREYTIQVMLQVFFDEKGNFVYGREV